MAGRGGNEKPGGDKAKQPGEAGFGGIVSSMAQQYIGGGGTERPVDAGAGEKQAAGGGVMGVAGHMAHQYMGGGEGAHVAEGGEKAQPGLVDRLLSMYSESTGKPFEGTEGEYDQLSQMAHSALGTPIGREVLKSWVKQRMGF